jgi:hypothetical protein
VSFVVKPLIQQFLNSTIQQFNHSAIPPLTAARFYHMAFLTSYHPSDKNFKHSYMLVFRAGVWKMLILFNQCQPPLQ